MKKKVLVAMSGGVDSSVAAFLLREEGFEVVGVTMCLGIPDTRGSKVRCCGQSAIEDAKRVSDQLKIAHYVLDFSKEMQSVVVDNFVFEYIKGRTPNPCVACNEYLKFGKLFEYARSFAFDFLATGHYAKIAVVGANTYLQRPKDRKKDQTYFLYPIAKEKLSQILFPLAEYTKEEVRSIARKANLAVAEKRGSQDVCFIFDNNYKKFIQERVDTQKGGDIVDTKGTVLGKHNGIFNFTRGQREGLNVALGKPMYVVGLDSQKNQVIIGEKDQLKSTVLIAENINSLVDAFPKNAAAKIRYAHTPGACSITFMDAQRARVVFDEPQEAITPGQSVVFYQDDTVCGGGIIRLS